MLKPYWFVKKEQVSSHPENLEKKKKKREGEGERKEFKGGKFSG